MTGFDVQRFARLLDHGHGGRLGIRYHRHQDGEDGWVELALPYAPALIGDAASGAMAAGPIVTLMDMATSIAIWARRGRFLPHATLDLRLDQLRPALAGRTLIGRGVCYRLAGPVAYVRGEAHDGDPNDPVAHVVGTFMATGLTDSRA
jgi:acyl-coenzyme A thioesterase PaaI-like protein